MIIKNEQIQGVLIVTLEGEIDHHTSEEIRETVDRLFQKKRAKSIVFDFKDVHFMDSSGIGMLIGRYKNVLTFGGKVAVYGVNSNVDKLLQMSGVYKLIQAFQTKEDAIKSVTL